MLRVRSLQELFAGLALIALAAAAFWFVRDLDPGRAVKMGPGYFPQVLCGLIGISGILVALTGFTTEGPGLERWRWHGIAIVLGAIVFYAFTIRTLGLAVAGGLTVLISSAAAMDFKWKQSVLFTAALMVFTILLFPIALSVPIPIWPQF